MSYEKQNFKDGQVLTAEMLNKMEAWMAMAQPPIKETAIFVEQVSITTVATPATDTVFINMTQEPLTLKQDFVSGDVYTVTFEGVEYECLFDGSTMGNKTLFSVFFPDAEDTGEPFLIILMDDDFGAFTKDEGSFNISVMGSLYTPLEQWCIPNAYLLDLVTLGLPTVNKDERVSITITDTSQLSEIITALNSDNVRVKLNAIYSDLAGSSNVGAEEFLLIAPVQYYNGEYHVTSITKTSIVDIGFVIEEGCYIYVDVTQLATA